MTTTYQQYLRSDLWEKVRNKALKKHGCFCYGCSSVKTLNLHHVYYPEDINNTTEDHLVPLCFKCHSVVHNKADLIPFTRVEQEIESKKLEILMIFGKTKPPISFNQHAAWISEAEKRRRIETDHFKYMAAQRRLARRGR